jgi:tetratricopeptide (TPR) repeat protein
VLYTFLIGCDPDFDAPCLRGAVDAPLFRRIIGHWDAFERLAPLDPRLLPGIWRPGVRFERALLHTKLASEPDLRRAVTDYELLLDHAVTARIDPAVPGNLAESYMMLGDLDRAVLTYLRALDGRNEPSLVYGLAVAYDRDGQGGKARELVRALGEDAFARWHQEVEKGNTFYVPDGEVHYYYAVIYQALGHPRHAERHWRWFLDSGAHPRYQGRAREHLRALQARDRSRDADPLLRLTPRWPRP